MMPLSPQSIGLAMSHGFAGSYARQPDMIVNTAPLGGTATIPFGTPLVRGQDGAVIPMGSGNTGNQFVGVAGREVKTATQYNGQSVGSYAPGEAVSVFQRGNINVKCQKGAPVIDGTVYVRVAARGDYAVGGFEAEADGANTVALSNAQWGGPADGNGVAELRIAYVGPVPAVAGTPGPAGEDGGYYEPSVDASGNLSWTASKTGMPAVEGANIRGPQGPAGAQGPQGEIGPQGPAGADGAAGAQGPAGAAAGFGNPTATVDAETGTPSVTVTASGPDTAKVFAFAFHNLKGEPGAAGARGPEGPQGPAGPSYTLPAATTGALGGVKQMAAITDLAAAPTMEDFNNLLAALRTAGMLATS